MRHWFIGGDQRWLTMVGYTRAQEDQLFERIRWPMNGYDLFRIGVPMSENPEPWFDGTQREQLPDVADGAVRPHRRLRRSLRSGWRWICQPRSVAARQRGRATAPLVAPIGEASFHQFHGGTTTNVDDVEKDLRVRAYASAYRALRGEDFTMVGRGHLTFRGRIALGIRHPAWVNAR